MKNRLVLLSRTRWLNLVGPLTAALLVSCPQPTSAPVDDDDDDDDGVVDPTERIDPDDLEALAVRPSEALIGLDTELRMKAIATTNGGEVYDAALVDWRTSDPAVAIIDVSGRVTPVGPGEVEITAMAGELASTAARIRVTADLQVRVQVIDGATGAPLPGATVVVGAGRGDDTGTTDGEGQVLLTRADTPLPLTVTADLDGYRRATVAGSALRDLTIPLLPRAIPAPSARVSGSFAFDPAPPGQINVALALGSIEQNPVFIQSVDLLGPARSAEELSEFGVPWPLPDNVQVGELLPNFHVDAAPGQRAISIAAGQFELTEILALMTDIDAAGFGAAIALLAQSYETLQVGVSETLTLESGEHVQEFEMASSDGLELETWLRLGLPPTGYYWPDPITVLAMREVEGAGSVIAGIGVGAHPFEDVPPDGDDDDDDATDSVSDWSPPPEEPAGLWEMAESAVFGSSFDPGSRDREEPQAATQYVTAPVYEVAREDNWADVPSQYMAWVQVGGITGGSSEVDPNGTSQWVQVISPPTFQGSVTLPPFLEPVNLSTDGLPEYVDHLRWFADETVDMTHHSLIRAVTAEGVEATCSDPHSPWDPELVLWDVYTAGGMQRVDLPTVLPDLAIGEENDRVFTIWRVDSVGLDGVSFDSLVAPSDEPLTDWKPTVRRRAVNLAARCAIIP